MRYRRLTGSGDMAIGQGGANYLTDVPEAVAQAVVTRLRLLSGEWFLDLTEGTPYVPSVFGKHTAGSYDLVVRERILDTQGVTAITAYESIFDGETRTLTVNVTIDTVYGSAIIQEVL